MIKNTLKETDPQIYDFLKNEKHRQNFGLEMIPSENFVSKAVLEALGSIGTNKYSEGYPGKRYYGGNKNIDDIELLAIERAKKLFNAEHANVQPLSGSPANMQAYFALLELGDKILGMNLAHGGHLTHGHPVNFSGKFYKFSQYGVREDDHRIDYDEVRKIAEKEKPKLILSGATAYPREIDFKEFDEIAKDVGAISMADVSHIAGLIVSDVHKHCFPYTDVVTTTTHKTLRGPRGAIILCKEKYAKAIDKAVFPGMQGGPHNHTNAAKAVAFGEALRPEFKNYAVQIVKNAKVLADELIDYDFKLISGGTDNHLILIDLTNKNVTGKQAEAALDEANITVNKNMVPFDKRSPFDPSGIRIGTPAITARGLKEQEMVDVAAYINEVIENIDNREKILKVKEKVVELSSRFIIYD
ncbi:MAG: serine hydroxymethyltransferase [Nanoarchaeota archaeon]|nr:serine hydroxymethyltransferase [Nanoarchaeota archaeon]